MKLHLGCGQVLLEGYHNIDFPQSHHSVQRIAADEYADITAINYPPGTIDEVRLHHVFEHFPRWQALALLVVWRNWLKPGGKVRIEVPDFFRTAINALNPASTFKQRSTAIRHIFGSNEAEWAVHYEGWTEDRLSRAFSICGYSIISCRRNNWKGTHNIEVVAIKTKEMITPSRMKHRISEYLALYLVDDSKSEQNLLKVWLKNYESQLKRSKFSK